MCLISSCKAASKLHKPQVARAHLHCTPASTANHDLSSGRAHTKYTVGSGGGAVSCMGNCEWAFLHEGRQHRQRSGARGRNGSQRWPAECPRWGQQQPRRQISAPPPFRSTFLRQKSRAAFQGWRRGAGEAAQFLARHQAAAANIHSVSALLPGGGACCWWGERSGWRQGGQIGWLHRGASCLSARQHSAAGATQLSSSSSHHRRLGADPDAGRAH